MNSADNTSVGVAGLFVLAEQSSADMSGSVCQRLGIPMIYTMPDLNFLQ